MLLLLNNLSFKKKKVLCHSVSVKCTGVPCAVWSYVRGPALACLDSEECEDGVHDVVVVEVPTLPGALLHGGFLRRALVHKVLTPATQGQIQDTRSFI